jgi:hypothetical protein
MICKAEENSYWVVVLVANEETGVGTINSNLGEKIPSIAAAKEIVLKDWQERQEPLKKANGHPPSEEQQPPPMH